jgi:hypothetical protein
MQTAYISDYFTMEDDILATCSYSHASSIYDEGPLHLLLSTSLARTTLCSFPLPPALPGTPPGYFPHPLVDPAQHVAEYLRGSRLQLAPHQSVPAVGIELESLILRLPTSQAPPPTTQLIIINACTCASNRIFTTKYKFHQQRAGGMGRLT